MMDGDVDTAMLREEARGALPPEGTGPIDAAEVLPSDTPAPHGADGMGTTPRARRVRDARLGPFLLGLFLCLPGVAIAWLATREEGGWTGRVQAAAWLGCVLSPAWWTFIVIACALLVVAGVAPLSHLLTGRW